MELLAGVGMVSASIYLFTHDRAILSGVLFALGIITLAGSVWRRRPKEKA